MVSCEGTRMILVDLHTVQESTCLLKSNQDLNQGKMYTLLSGLYNHITQKDDFYILILGLDNAGKTTFLECAKAKFTKDYNGIKPSKITSTVGLNIGQIEMKGIR